MAIAPGEVLSDMVDRTPADRDRVVDAARAASIAVVVVWHWSLSITHRAADGSLVNPNPIAEVPLGWLATWVLQVMPLFFVVGGFANLAGWRSTVADGGGATAFWAARARRLLGPVAVGVAVWIVADVAARTWVEGWRGILTEAELVVMPLWFIGAYLWVVALVPLTARLHERWALATTGGLAVAIVAVDVARFALDVGAAAWLNTALVWVLIHQLGYWYGSETLRRRGVSAAAGLVGAGVAILTVATSTATYPRSMVATTETDISHMYPTTAVIAALALVHLGLLLLVRGPANRLLERRRPWMVVVAINAVIMTIFVWHMTALYLFVLAVEAGGVTLGADATVAWWAARPLWIIGPGAILAVLVAVFGGIELGRRAMVSPGAGRTSRQSPD
ncbi:MAG: acyltransferase family protein [Acidimicrobiales bacterium]